MKHLQPSPSNTYVIKVYSHDYTGISFKQFTLPDDYICRSGNDCSSATWYFFNKLDAMSAGDEAFPIEMYKDLQNLTPVEEEIELPKEAMPYLTEKPSDEVMEAFLNLRRLIFQEKEPNPAYDMLMAKRKRYRDQGE